MYHPETAVRLTARNLGKDEDGMKSIPLYAAFCL